MTDSIPIAVPRKGRPLEAVLERFATVGSSDELDRLADRVHNILKFEKAVTTGAVDADDGPYHRLLAYSDPTVLTEPEFTIMRDDRTGKPRRIVFDAATVEIDGFRFDLIGREEPFRALRTHEFALGFDSADLVLEEVVGIRRDGLTGLEDVNDRIDPVDTDVRVVDGLGDTVYHTVLAHPDILTARTQVTRNFIDAYTGELCISPRYERLITAVLGTAVLEDIQFVYPAAGYTDEEEAIADIGLGVYLTVTGTTAREYGLTIGEDLFPSETVLLCNTAERTPDIGHASDLLSQATESTAFNI